MNRFGKRKRKSKKEKSVVGEIRQSQLITTYGCGSIVDFVDHTVIIAGTDDWKWVNQKAYIENNKEFIVNNENLQNLLGVDFFVKPKTDQRRQPFYAEKSKDIPAYRFPEILYCTACKRLHHFTAFDHQQGRQLICSCGKKGLLPSRFVAVCEAGHIEDFPYDKWVHRGAACPKEGDKPDLSLFNIGKKASVESLVVKCNKCEAIRSMKNAFAENALANVKKCSGYRPWLAKSEGPECGGTLKTRLRTATNVYFPVTLSALSIPPWSRKAYKIMAQHFSRLSSKSNDSQMAYIRDIILPDCPGFSLQDLLTIFKKLKSNKGEKGKKRQQDIFQEEYKVLSMAKADDVDDADDDYLAHRIEPPARYQSVISNVVAVEKLTEVVAMKGFTRIKPWSGNLTDERIAPLSSHKQNWLPGIQLNGEGIFIEFHREPLMQWAAMADDYYIPMKQNLDTSFFVNERFSPQYILLHTFAHLLIRQLALDCGYGAASLKEKIYSTFSTGEDDLFMAGVLIYTATPDADGSLGGLVEQSLPDQLGPLIDRMLQEARWCSSDPLCSASYGEHGQGFYSLNYAACHACTLLPETACEYRNLLLDRGAVIGRPDKPELGFFNIFLKDAESKLLQQ